MLRNMMSSALHHLLRNRFYTGISVLGLALGLAAALLAGLVVQSQLSRDHFIPGFRRIHLAMTVVTPPGRAPVYTNSANSFVGPQLQQRIPEIEASTRLFLDNVQLRRGQLGARERIYWADVN